MFEKKSDLFKKTGEEESKKSKPQFDPKTGAQITKRELEEREKNQKEDWDSWREQK